MISFEGLLEKGEMELIKKYRIAKHKNPVKLVRKENFDKKSYLLLRFNI
jgi:hypothetical protein